MKKYIVGLIALVVLTVGVVGAQVFATDDMTPGATSLVKGMTHDGTYFVADGNVTVSGTVHGDVFCAGQTIVVDGDIDGDVICAGQTITINGHVKGNVRLAGQTVTLAGTIDKSATIAAATVVTDSKFQLGQDLTVTASDTSLSGTIGRDLTAAGETLSVRGAIGRNITAAATQVRIENGASVAGGVTYTSSNVAAIANDTVKGSINHQESAYTPAGPSLTDILAGLLLMMVTAVLLVLIAPRPYALAVTDGVKRPLRVVLYGLGAIIFLPIIAVLAFLSGIGTIVGGILLVLWALILLLSISFASLFVGQLVLANRNNNVLIKALLGGAILAILIVIPFIGAFVMVAGGIVGAGLITNSILHSLLGKPTYHFDMTAPTKGTSKKATSSTE